MKSLMASEKIQIEKFNDWSVLRQETDAGRLCYITSEPIEKKGDYDKNNRGETRVFVTHGPGKAERDVVSIVAGYVFEKQSRLIYMLMELSNSFLLCRTERGLLDRMKIRRLLEI